MTLAGTRWAEQGRKRVSPDVSSSLRNHLCECKGCFRFLIISLPTRHPEETSEGFEGFSEGGGGGVCV